MSGFDAPKVCGGPHAIRPGDPPTPRQAEVFRFIVAFIAENRRAPSVRSMMARFGLGSTNAVIGYLRGLERRGLLSLVPSPSGKDGQHLIWPVGLVMRLEWEDSPAGRRARAVAEGPP